MEMALPWIGMQLVRLMVRQQPRILHHHAVPLISKCWMRTGLPLYWECRPPITSGHLNSIEKSGQPLNMRPSVPGASCSAPAALQQVVVQEVLLPFQLSLYLWRRPGPLQWRCPCAQMLIMMASRVTVRMSEMSPGPSAAELPEVGGPHIQISSSPCPLDARFDVTVRTTLRHSGKLSFQANEKTTGVDTPTEVHGGISLVAVRLRLWPCCKSGVTRSEIDRLHSFCCHLWPFLLYLPFLGEERVAIACARRQ